jgi:hypothetical protein
VKRTGSIIAVAALAITLIVTSLLPAQATLTEAHLRRQINRLESQVREPSIDRGRVGGEGPFKAPCRADDDTP